MSCLCCTEMECIVSVRVSARERCGEVVPRYPKLDDRLNEAMRPTRRRNQSWLSRISRLQTCGDAPCTGSMHGERDSVGTAAKLETHMFAAVQVQGR
jgi:hypothetical protein